jgi:hypothetical protein
MFNRVIALAAAAVPMMLRRDDKVATLAIPFGGPEATKYAKSDVRGFEIGTARPNRSTKQAKPKKRSNRATISARTKRRHRRSK